MDIEKTKKYLDVICDLQSSKPDWNVFDFSWASGLTIQKAYSFLKENKELVDGIKNEKKEDQPKGIKKTSKRKSEKSAQNEED